MRQSPKRHARIAKIAVAKGDEPADRLRKISEFPIKPGTHTQFVALSGTDLETAHFYIHVSGNPEKWDPFYSDAGSAVGPGEAPLEERPIHYVPIKVPIYDEVATIKARRSDEDAAPVYRMVYRPEMRFSVLDLEGPKLLRTYSEDRTDDVFDYKIPFVSTSDSQLEFDYTLLQDEFDPLDPLGPGTTAAIVAGDCEYEATVSGEEASLSLDLDMLDSLDAEGFLALRLYMNHDPENILWEFAFENVLITPDEAETEEIAISADKPELSLNLVIAGYSMRKPEDREPYEVRWTSSAGSVEPASEEKSSGYFATTLTMPKTKGASATVRASLGEGAGNGFVESPTIRVVAGKPKSIDVQCSGRTAIGEIGEVTIAATVRDEWGNLVEDGTGVDFSVDGDTSFSSEFSTTDGVARAVLKGLETPGEKYVTISSGDTKVVETVVVEDVEITISMPSTILAGEKCPVTIHASTAAGSMDGRAIALRRNRGQLEEYEPTLAGGAVATTYYAGKLAGSGAVIASFAGARAVATFEVEKPPGAPGLSSPLIIGDLTEDGTVVVETPEGDLEVGYVASTTLTVTGDPDETVPVTLGSLSNPPVEPVLHYSMSGGLLGNEVEDTYGVINGVCTNIGSSRESSEGFGGSFVFQSDSAIRIGNHTGLDKDSEIGFSLDFKPSQASGTLVDFHLRSQKLAMEPDGRLRYEVETEDGVFEVFSAPVEPDAWHTAAAHYKDGSLLLEVDGNLASVPATGALERFEGPAGVEIGTGYAGLMGQFRIIDWSAPLLATLPNGDTRMDVAIGPDGTAEAVVSSTGSLGDRSFVEGPSGYRIAFGFFVPEAFAEAYAGGWTGSVGAGTSETELSIWDIATYAKRLAFEAAAGAFTGDTSTVPGAVADLLVSCVPLGDSREIAFQYYYKYSGATDENGNPKYDKLVQNLAWLGLACDLLSITGVGEAVNVVIGALKTVVKVIDRVRFKAFYEALSAHIDLVAKAARERNDWSMVENMVPFAQFALEVIYDKELREFLCGAIGSTKDLVVWIVYIGRWDEKPDELVDGFEKFPFDFLVEQALAKQMSAFKEALQLLLYKFDTLPENLGKEMTVILQTLNKACDEGSDIITEAYEQKTIEALVNIFHIGGKNSVVDVSNFGSLGRKVDGVFYGRLVDELLDDLTKIKLGKIEENNQKAWDFFTDKYDRELLQNAQDVQNGLVKLLNHLSIIYDNSNYPKGAAHHVRVLAETMDQVVGVELKRMAVKLKNGVPLGNREYDILANIGDVLTRMELKSWLPQYVEQNTRSYLTTGTKIIVGGVEKTKEPKQLLIDLVAFAENDYKGYLWIFDKGMAGSEQLFKDTVEDVLLHHEKTKEKIYGWLGGMETFPDDDAYIEWVDRIVKRLDSFIIVKE